MFVIKLKSDTTFKDREEFDITLENREVIDFNKNSRRESFKKRFFNCFKDVKLYFAYLIKV